MPMRTAASENHKPHARILEKDRIAARFDGDDDRGRDRAHQIVRRIDLDRVAAPDPDHKIGKDDRKAERDQRLTKILPLHPAEDEELHGSADDRAANKCHDVAKQPRAGPLAGLVAHVAAEQIKRPVRQVDVAHQAEDQRESGGDEKVQPAERDAVEQRIDEEPFLAEYVLETRRPRRQHEPKCKYDDDGNDKRRNRMAPDPAAQRVAAPGIPSWSVIAKSRGHGLHSKLG